MTPRAPDPVFQSSRREAGGALLVWLLAMLWTVGYCWSHGYGRDPKSLTYVLGFPDWVFWGIVCPWAACFVMSYGFAFWWIRDEDLGEENEDADEL